MTEPISFPAQTHNGNGQRDAFDLLNLPPKFDLSSADIQRAARKRSMALHPDRQVALSSSMPTSDASIEQINAARAQLIDPEQRAMLLLARSTSRADWQGVLADRSLPPGFLQHIMDMREQAETALQSHDRTAIDTLTSWAQSTRAEYLALLSTLFSQPLTPQAIRQVRTTLNAWRYIERMLAQLSEAQSKP